MHLHTIFGKGILVPLPKKWRLFISWASHSIWHGVSPYKYMQRSGGRRVEIFLWESLGKYLPSSAVQLALKVKSLCLKSVFVRAEISPYWKGSFSHILREDMSSDGKTHFDKPWKKSKEFWLATARNLWHLWNNCIYISSTNSGSCSHLSTVVLYLRSIFEELNTKQLQKRRYLIRWLLFPFQKQGQTTHNYTAHF